MASRRSPACTGPPVGAVVPVPPVGGAVVPLGEAVVPAPELDPESLPVASWNAITPSAAARATTSAITSVDGRPRGALGGTPPPRPESPGGPGGGSWATGSRARTTSGDSP